MPNHPNRNWRRRMHEAADAWLALWPWKPEAGARLLTDLELQDSMRKAFLAGFEACRRIPTEKS